MFPLLSEYIESIKSAGDNFDELKFLRPILDEDGLPIMTSGNFAEYWGLFSIDLCKNFEIIGIEAFRNCTTSLQSLILSSTLDIIR